MKLIRIFCLLFITISIAAASDSSGPLASRQRALVLDALQGRWLAEAGTGRMVLQLAGNGIGHLDDARVAWRVAGDTLLLTMDTITVPYRLELAGAVLKLSGAGLAQPLAFTRQADAGRIWSGLVRPGAFAVHGLEMKIRRLAAVIIMTVAAVLFIAFLRLASRFLIFNETGPLRYLYRNHKSRTLTIHSVLLNLAKYIVYFMAFGYVLSELGVNYTAYIASLSVVGLAVGFGAQGLVQDLVTGFFILFEGQFDVGDMIEVSGQTGVVAELGLRMTRLKNFAGQMVVIPNRNIAMIGRYRAGGLETTVDVAAEPGAAAGAALEQAAADVNAEYADVIIRPFALSARGNEPAAAGYLRLKGIIWPGQQWVAEQQLAGRIRAACAAQGAVIPGDRITVHYRGGASRRRQKDAA